MEQSRLSCLRFWWFFFSATMEGTGEYDLSKTFYYYGMRLRGFSPGCQPMDGFVLRCVDLHDERYYDILLYDRKLTEKELRDYELDFMKEAEYTE